MTVQSAEDPEANKGQDASDRRERILDAALSLFAEHGVEGTTM
ncbi:MAG TPA: TetR family transcriptional regulator, partial [Phycisphaerales bacterium]|nr:TetR family transcriptional regulator [Phycisphaerales bacterium]